MRDPTSQPAVGGRNLCTFCSAPSFRTSVGLLLLSCALPPWLGCLQLPCAPEKHGLRCVLISTAPVFVTTRGAPASSHLDGGVVGGCCKLQVCAREGCRAHRVSMRPDSLAVTQLTFGLRPPPSITTLLHCKDCRFQGRPTSFPKNIGPPLFQEIQVTAHAFNLKLADSRRAPCGSHL